MFPSELGGDHHLSLERFQRFADQFLVREWTVHFGCVEESEAALDRFVKEFDHLLFVGWCIAETHPHAAKPEAETSSPLFPSFRFCIFSILR